MSYWLYVTNLQNWEITKRKNILGAAERHRKILSHINKNDKILVYIKSERLDKLIVQPQVAAEYEAASDIFEDDRKIFDAPQLLPEERFRLRIKLRLIKLCKQPIMFKPLVPELDFIKNKHYWSTSLRGRAVVRLSEHDYDTISSKCERTA